ncbi:MULTISPECIES: nucleotide excision repair endonuclease [Metabacillus]|uniref:Nucleotide excision repair endonuclease n=1 Tax=Metabacillus rhizolycopersici TaxID=2875709 RepID=A0ABS7USM3_9BACI|nr:MULTISPECIES: nucleotide excision repair endonuclease [Metabacillus]MBZ5751037.1 nucleotide excision repair endonuclease [Metabacillus rhizolycopersici]MCM3651850.1 nucleotide excision repair endonuclease [Metabacillus litoralis]
MIKIEIPSPDLVVVKKRQLGEKDEPVVSSVYGFTDYMKVPRDKSGVYMFFNNKDELLFVGKARKLRLRIRKHFEDNVSPIKPYRDEVYKIGVVYVEDPIDREIYETYIINTLQAKYNVDKVFFR